MVKRRLSFQSRRMKELTPSISDLLSSLENRGRVLGRHLDMLRSGEASVEEFSNHLERYIRNLIILNDLIKKFIQ